MISFIIRRLFQLLFVVWGGVTLLFLLFFALPSNPAELLAGGGNRVPNPQVVKAVEKKYGLDDPIYVQYFRYIGHVATFDFGKS